MRGSEVRNDYWYGWCYCFDSWWDARSFTTAAFIASVQITTQEKGKWQLSFITKIVLTLETRGKISGTPLQICRPHFENHCSNQTLWFSLLLRKHKNYKFPKTYTVTSIRSNLDVVYHEQPLVKAHTDEMIECVQSKQKGISAELSTPLQKLQVDFSCLNRMTI